MFFRCFPKNIAVGGVSASICVNVCVHRLIPRILCAFTHTKLKHFKKNKKYDNDWDIVSTQSATFSWM